MDTLHRQSSNTKFLNPLAQKLEIANANSKHELFQTRICAITTFVSTGLSIVFGIGGGVTIGGLLGNVPGAVIGGIVGGFMGGAFGIASALFLNVGIIALTSRKVEVVEKNINEIEDEIEEAPKWINLNELIENHLKELKTNEAPSKNNELPSDENSVSIGTKGNSSTISSINSSKNDEKELLVKEESKDSSGDDDKGSEVSETEIKDRNKDTIETSEESDTEESNEETDLSSENTENSYDNYEFFSALDENDDYQNEFPEDENLNVTNDKVEGIELKKEEELESETISAKETPEDKEKRIQADADNKMKVLTKCLGKEIPEEHVQTLKDLFADCAEWKSREEKPVNYPVNETLKKLIADYDYFSGLRSEGKSKLEKEKQEASKFLTDNLYITEGFVLTSPKAGGDPLTILAAFGIIDQDDETLVKIAYALVDKSSDIRSNLQNITYFRHFCNDILNNKEKTYSDHVQNLQKMVDLDNILYQATKATTDYIKSWFGN